MHAALIILIIMICNRINQRTARGVTGLRAATRRFTYHLCIMHPTHPNTPPRPFIQIRTLIHPRGGTAGDAETKVPAAENLDIYKNGSETVFFQVWK